MRGRAGRRASCLVQAERAHCLQPEATDDARPLNAEAVRSARLDRNGVLDFHVLCAWPPTTCWGCARERQRRDDWRPGVYRRR
eukprot:2467424-Prymnesium_polylepis.1